MQRPRLTSRVRSGLQLMLTAVTPELGANADVVRAQEWIRLIAAAMAGPKRTRRRRK